MVFLFDTLLLVLKSEIEIIDTLKKDFSNDI